MSADKPRLTTSAMIASIAGEGQPTRPAPFGEALKALAAERPEIVGLTADLAKYTDLHIFAQAYPDRFYQMGMAEQLLMSAAAGLAREGFLPFATTYAVFASRRAYDFIAMAIAEENLPVKIVCALPGLTTGYGPSHQATEDVAIFRGLPNMTIVDPCDAVDIAGAVPAIADHPGPVYMRLLRGQVPVVLDRYDYCFTLGRAALLRDGADALVISAGLMTMRALEAADLLAKDGIAVAVLHSPTIKPLDEATILREAGKSGRLVVVAENHSVVGGLGEAVAGLLLRAGVHAHLPAGRLARRLSRRRCAADAARALRYFRRSGGRVHPQVGRRMSGGVVGFVGLGAMGTPMAANLLRAGFAVRGYDTNPAALRALEAAGGRAERTAADAADGADALLLMVVNADQARAVLFADGALAALPEGASVVLMATCSPRAVAEMAAEVEASGRRFVDAPVSGGVAGATAANLTVMAAAPAGHIAAVRPVLDAIGGKVVHVGERPGQGAVVKSVNQLLCGVHIAAAAEALALAAKVGVDTSVMLDIVSGSAASSWMLKDRGPRMLRDAPEVTSAVDIFVKDLGIVLEAGRDSTAALPLAALAHQLFLSAAAQGLGKSDDSQVVRVYHGLNGAT